MKKNALFVFLLGIVFVFCVTPTFCEENRCNEITVDDLKIVYEISPKWFLADLQKDSSKKIQVYLYKREPIIDSNGIRVIPSIGFIFEEVPDDIDAVMYSVNARSRMAPVDIKSMFTWQSSEIKLNNAIGYNSEYIDNQGYKHVLVFVHAVYKGKGIQIIIDTTLEVYPQIKAELDGFLKSIEVVE